MNNMKDVYYRLCTEFKAYAPIMNDEEDLICMNNGTVRIDINKKYITLYVKGKRVARSLMAKEDQFNTTYRMVKYFVKNYNKLVMKNRISWVIFVLLLVGVIYLIKLY